MDNPPGNIVAITAFSNAPTSKKNAGPVAFNRQELDAILRVYGQMVANGQWRDYAIDHMDDKAVFSIFRRASEMPLYRIEKNPKLANKQGIYCVIAASGMVLKRGHELKTVLRVFDKALSKLIKL